MNGKTVSAFTLPFAVLDLPVQSDLSTQASLQELWSGEEGNLKTVITAANPLTFAVYT